tara:strand:- start:17 stop:946 length:930 start_codon:yes stop_codon:yes gene_type:complete
MVTYNCERCGYSSNNKSYFKKHLLRKIPCQAIIKDIPISEIYDKIYGVNSYNTTKCIAKSNTKKDITKIRSNTPKYADTLQEYAENTLKYAQIRSEPKSPIICNNCGKTFKERRYLVQHTSRNSCNMSHSNLTDSSDVQKDIIIASQNEIIKELKTQIETLLKEKGNTYSYTQNIIVQPFGKEKIEYIKDSYVKSLINKGPMNCIPNLLKAIHFDNQHKENLNVKIPNKKMQLAQIFNGKNWEFKDKKTTIENMTNKAYGIINKHYETGSNIYMDSFRDNYENEDKDIVKKLCKDTEIMILNNQANEIV